MSFLARAASAHPRGTGRGGRGRPAGGLPRRRHRACPAAHV